MIKKYPPICVCGHGNAWHGYLWLDCCYGNCMCVTFRDKAK